MTTHTLTRKFMCSCMCGRRRKEERKKEIQAGRTWIELQNNTKIQTLFVWLEDREEEEKIQTV